MKKRLLALVIALLLVGCACAEAPDWSRMTDDELVSAYDGIRMAMERRNIPPAAERSLREGKYVIGRDIAPGLYTITCTSTAGEAAGDAYGSLGSMMDSLDDNSDSNWSSFYGSLGSLMGEYMEMTVEIIGDYGDVLNSYGMKSGDSLSIKLEEGTALKISDGSCTVRPE